MHSMKLKKRFVNNLLLISYLFILFKVRILIIFFFSLDLI